jgi:hypothetical protein
MADFGEIGGWVEKHPYATGAIVFGGGLVLLWAFGYLGGSSSSSAETGTNNLAAAYYAAEAAQTTAGTQLQMATVAANSADAQTATQANAAVAINQANADMETTLGSQTTTAAQTLYNDQLQSSITSANDTMAENNVNQAYLYQTTLAGNNAQETLAALNGILPQELALNPSHMAALYIPGVGNFGVGGTTATPNDYAAAGYTAAEIAAAFG